LVFAAAIMCPVGGTLAQTTFTYQGQLKSAGTTYSGTADLRFTLFTAVGGGSMVGAPVDVIGIVVNNGLVTTQLNFGPAAFDGTPRWLEVGVRTPSNGGVGPYAPLTPRQPVSPAPYAMHALNASISGAQPNAVSFTNTGNAFTGSGSGLTALNASNLASGTVGGQRLAGAYTNALTLNNANNSFTGSGAGLTALSASNISSGTLNIARFPTGGSWPITSNLTIDGSTLCVDQTGDRIGIGITSPNARLQIVGGPPWTSDFWNKAIHIGNGHAMEAFTPTTKFGIGATDGLPGGPSLRFFHANAEDTTPSPNYYMVHNSSGQVGIGTTPTQKLHVVDMSGTGHAVIGVNQSTSVAAVAGVNNAANGYGVYGQAAAGPNGVGVFGQVMPGNGGAGVWGLAPPNGVGVAGSALFPGIGVNCAGDFVASGSKNFRIDHPFDPANKYLHHHCTEGADPLNVYSGTVMADGAGQAWVQLPDYFQAINRDPRYQLTAIGAPAPNLHIAREIASNRFLIAGAGPGMKVSWRVEAVRNDRWVQTHGIRVEVDKPAHLRGKYQHPELYGLGDEYAELPRHRPSALAADAASAPAQTPTPVSHGSNH
jgi:hypothetical protein